MGVELTEVEMWVYSFHPKCIRGSNRFTSAAADWLDMQFGVRPEMYCTEGDFNSLRKDLAAAGISLLYISRTLVQAPVIENVE